MGEQVTISSGQWVNSTIFFISIHKIQLVPLVAFQLKESSIMQLLFKKPVSHLDNTLGESIVHIRELSKFMARGAVSVCGGGAGFSG